MARFIAKPKFLSYRHKTWMMVLVGVVVVATIPAVRACSWSYPIWGIRNRPADPLFRFVRNGKAGYIDSSGRIVLQPILPASGNFFSEFHEGLVAVKDERGYRYLDRSGAVVFHVDAWLAFDFSEGLAPASQKDPSRWGFVDRTGRFVIPPRYFWVDPFSEGLARISVSGEVGSTGYIDRNGNFVIPPRLSYGSNFHEGRAAVIVGGPCQITNGGSCARAEFKPTQTFTSTDCRYAFIDASGKPISELRFDDATDFSEGLAAVRVGREWGYVDKFGRISILPRFDYAEPFSEGLAAVRQNGKTGFIEHSGRFVIPAQFESADNFSDGRALVSEGNGQGKSSYLFIDRSGKRAFPGNFETAAPFAYGLAHVALNGSSKGSFAWINTAGKPIFSYTGR